MRAVAPVTGRAATTRVRSRRRRWSRSMPRMPRPTSSASSPTVRPALRTNLAAVLYRLEDAHHCRSAATECPVIDDPPGPPIYRDDPARYPGCSDRQPRQRLRSEHVATDQLREHSGRGRGRRGRNDWEPVDGLVFQRPVFGWIDWEFAGHRTATNSTVFRTQAHLHQRSAGVRAGRTGRSECVVRVGFRHGGEPSRRESDFYGQARSASVPWSPPLFPEDQLL